MVRLAAALALVSSLAAAAGEPKAPAKGSDWVEMEVKDHEEGGRNDGVVRRMGRAKYQPLVLKRGMFGTDGSEANADLWQWLQDVVSGVRPVRRYDGAVTVLDGEGEPRVTWAFTRGLPSRLVGPSLDARTGEIAMEELHIAHEGLVLEGTA